MRNVFRSLLVAAFLAAAGTSAAAATLSPALAARLASAASTDSVGVVIVAFNGGGPLSDAHLGVLRTAGITAGKTLPTLGMVATNATAAQVRALANHPSVRSIWSNDPLGYDMHQSRVLVGVDRMRADAGLTKLNGGMPVSGQGNFTVVVNDSGIDATHNDLKFVSQVVQNVQILADTDTAAGFTPLVAIENVPNTDTHVGHGTHVAGTVGGTGQQSGGLYAGVAPGVKLIGTGSGAGLFILAALGGFEWSLANQFQHNIRIITNSWGSGGGFNPDNPINIATKKAADQNIVVVFSASNSGPGWDTHNSYSKAPWVISVAAGTKEGGLANFSSRGTPKEQRLTNADPYDDYDAPAITAPGTGRQFTDNTKFTSDIVSVRSSSNVTANGLDADTELPVAFIPFYTQISGTSMAAPHVAGVAALLLDADPTLSAQEVREILLKTATRMPGFDDFEVGVGYVNAHAAVDLAFRRSKAYGTFLSPTFNANVATTWGPEEPYTLNYVPGAPGPTGPNTFRFQVEEGVDLVSVIADFGKNLVTDETGNAMGMVLWPPGCQQAMSPTGQRPPCVYSSGVALPVLDDARRQVVVKNPVAGEWIVEFGGVRGLTAAPQASSPVGISLPDTINSRVSKAQFALPPVADVTGHAFEASIYEALLNRKTDLKADGLYYPDELVTRADLARHLALNVPLRQTLSNTAKFSDVSADLAAIAEAVTAKGATLRDFNFSADGLMTATSGAFDPDGTVTRLDVAVAFVRAIGRDAEAKSKAGTTVMWNGTPVTDNASIPSALRGYVQVALDLGLMETYPAQVLIVGPGQFIALPGPRFEPASGITRGLLAGKLVNFSKIFASTF